MITATQWLREGARVPRQVDTITSCEEFEAACFLIVEAELAAGRELMLREMEGEYV